MSILFFRFAFSILSELNEWSQSAFFENLKNCVFGPKKHSINSIFFAQKSLRPMGRFPALFCLATHPTPPHRVVKARNKAWNGHHPNYRLFLFLRFCTKNELM